MATGTRSSKRKRKRARTEAGPEKTIVETPMEDAAEHEEADKPSGYPFFEAEVDWKYKRLHLVDKANKVIPAGYETMAGDVNTMLNSALSKSEADKVKNSVMGIFTQLDDFTTRSGKMLHYIVCHQVTPTPDFDPTTLFFKIGDTILRFSRVEYALVSGLKFGPSNFNPYVRHELPPNSVFERLFGGNDKIKLKEVHEAYTQDRFIVNGEKVRATSDDWVKLSKFLLCLGFALGFDPSKKKIPLWLWVLLEHEKEWEEFPWGSLSYQVLVEAIKGVTCLARRSAKINYTFKGNTVAFSAWIFEAIPAFGEIVGGKKKKFEMPRFMRYIYVKDRGYPTTEQIKERLNQKLKHCKDEKQQSYWKSLSGDPQGEPFAMTYDPTESMKKRPRDEEGNDLIGNSTSANASLLSTEKLDELAQVTAKKVLENMRPLLKEVLDEIVVKMAKKNADEEQPSTDTFFNWDQEAPYMPTNGDNASNKGQASVENAETMEGPTTEERGNKNMQPVADVAEPSSKDTLADPNSTVLQLVQIPTTGHEGETGHMAGVASVEAPGGEELGAEADITKGAAEIGADAQYYVISDTQIDREFDKLENLLELDDEVVDPQPIESAIAINARPVRIVYPSRECRSPFLRNDIRPRPDEFEKFLEKEDDERNVGLFTNVYKDFFEAIMKAGNPLTEDNVAAYLAILTARPDLAGLKEMNKRIGLTTCGLMDEINNVFDKLHGYLSVYEFDDFDTTKEEVVPEDDMKRLVVFANGNSPEWGENVKEWIEYDQVLTMATFGDNYANWVSVVLDLKKQRIEIHDPKAHKLNNSDWDHRKNVFLPLARLVPQMLKEVGFYTARNVRKPNYAQWDIVFGEQPIRSSFNEQKMYDSALYCLKWVERKISKGPGGKGLNNPKEIADYRKHVARTIYSHSTDGTTVPMILQNISM